jgi:hypothetical protein
MAHRTAGPTIDRARSATRARPATPASHRRGGAWWRKAPEAAERGRGTTSCKGVFTVPIAWKAPYVFGGSRGDVVSGFATADRSKCC